MGAGWGMLTKKYGRRGKAWTSTKSSKWTVHFKDGEAAAWV